MKCVNKWEIFCITENKYITNFLSGDKSPSVCFNNETHDIDDAKTKCLERIYADTTDCITEWELFCDTENIHVTGYTENDESPEKCFNNIEHVISKKPKAIRKIKNNTIRIKEEYMQTGGNFKAISKKMTCPVGISVHDHSFDYPISALSITLNTSALNTNDIVETDVGPDTVIGIITSDVAADTNVINVSRTAIEILNVGYKVTLDDGTNQDFLGIVTSIDLNNNTITTKNNTTHAFLTTSPTYVKMTVNIIEDFTIGYPGRYEIGKDKIGGSYVPPSTVIRVTYNNTGAETVDFYAVIEYLY